MLLMGKRKSRPKAPKKDYPHKHPVWGLRIPAEYKQQVQKLAEKTRRLDSEEVKIALEEYLGKQGLWPPNPEKPT